MSVWVGLSDQDQNKDILKDLCGVDYYDKDFQENVIAQNWELVPVRDLIEKLSFSASFIDEAVKSAETKGIKHARHAVAQLKYKYDPKKTARPPKVDPVFLGAFKWSR